MIIECPECGAKNQITQTPQSGKRYRCGKCHAEITLLEAVDTPIVKAEIHKTVETPTLATENTSGKGSLAVIPAEIREWNWGAFLLNWIWGLGNSVWIALLALIPYIGFIMCIVLGVKGNEWAWRYKKWDSVEHFKRTQRKWAKWGLVFLLLVLFLGFSAAVIIPNVGRFIGRGETEAVETELTNIQTAVIAVMVDNELSTLPNPVTIATDDMGAFPDTSICGVDKIQDRDGYIYVRGQDKDGYILYMHDIFADGSNSPTVNYVATQYTKGTYAVDASGTVVQVTTGYE